MASKFRGVAVMNHCSPECSFKERACEGGGEIFCDSEWRAQFYEFGSTSFLFSQVSSSVGVCVWEKKLWLSDLTHYFLPPELSPQNWLRQVKMKGLKSNPIVCVWEREEGKQSSLVCVHAWVFVRARVCVAPESVRMLTSGLFFLFSLCLHTNFRRQN